MTIGLDVGEPETRSTIALFVADDQAGRSAGVERLRAAAVEALHVLDVPMVLTSTAHLARYLERIDADHRIVLFVESPAVLAAARDTLGAERVAAHCLFVHPTSYAGDGAEEKWAEGLRAEAGENLVLLTDSALSRTIVENHLRASRADVRILTPRAAADGERPGDGLAEFKDWVPGEPSPQYSGLSWDFAERSVPDRHRVPMTATSESRRTNAEMLEPIVADRPSKGTPLHIGILGHKLSFIDELARDLGRSTGSSVELDEWEKLSGPPDRTHTLNLISRSDVVIGEWARPNNTWIQKRAPRDKRLIVRAHRYEVTTDFPHAIDMARFDAGVVIVPWVGRALVQKFGWPAEKMVYIPNYVNTSYFRRPKLPGAEFTLGIVGVTPDLKRLDLALDLLAALRAVDLRYALRVRGQLPPSHLHWSTNPRLSEQWNTVLFRLRTDPLLRNAVAFDPPGRDMAAWFEGIGVILSTSDLEGSHVALAEGVASGALPIARPWPGIRTLWPEDFVFDDLDSAVEQVLAARDAQWREETLTRFAEHPSLDQSRVLRAWWDLVRGDRAAAQSAFGPVDWAADWYEPVTT